MLRWISLIKLIFIAGLLSGMAQALDDNNVDLQWAKDLNKSSVDMVWKNLQTQHGEQQYCDGSVKSNDFEPVKPSTGLYIFVSTSMPKPLLKSYLNDAYKYNGILVFNGLPEGSFKAFAKLVRELAVNQDMGSLQIDDEAFTKFGVSVVPTIVLSQANEYSPTQSEAVTFDKITGNVGVQYALLQFEATGELQKLAKEHLHAAIAAK